MAQRSTRSERRSRSSRETRSAKQSSRVHRVDAPRNQGGHWISGTAISSPPASNDTRIDQLAPQESHAADFSEPTSPPHETAFERSVRQILANDRWRAQLEDLGQSLREAARCGQLTTSIVSLGDELDAARLVLALAMLTAESGRDALVVDGNRHRRTLSILLQHNSAAGLWDAVLADKPVRSLAIRLATRGVSFVPAGTRTLSPNSDWLLRALNTDRSSCPLMLLDTGVWPTPDLPMYVPASDLIYAVVRCGTSERKSYRELCQRLKAGGKRLAGCIVAGNVA